MICFAKDGPIIDADLARSESAVGLPTRGDQWLVLAPEGCVPPDTIGFTDRFLEPLDGVELQQFRHYDPTAERWLTNEPIGCAPDVNPYRYAANSPE